MSDQSIIANLEARLNDAANPRERINLLNALAQELARERASHPRALALSREAAELAQYDATADGPYLRGLAESYALQARLLSHGSEIGLALSLAQQAQGFSVALHDQPLEAAAWQVMAFCYRALGDYPAAMHASMQHFDLALAMDDQAEQAAALRALGLVYMAQDDYETAHAQFERSAAFFQQLGDVRGLASIYNNLCITHRHLGQFDQALECGERAKAIFDEQGLLTGLAYIHSSLGQVYLERGDFDTALDYFTAGLDHAQAANSPQIAVSLRVWIGETHACQCDYSRAIAALEETLRMADEMQAPEYQARCHEQLSTVYEQQGDLARALAHYRAYHAARETMLNEESRTRLNHLGVLHQTQQARTEAETQRQLREQDRAYYERLKQLQNEFLSTASHDLKNPLTSINMTVYVLEQHHTEDERTQQLLQRIQQNVQQMRTLITDLLDLARVEMKRELVTVEIDLHEFVDSILPDFQEVAQRKNIHIQYRDAPPKLLVRFDPVQMRQVLGNLLSNAIKYTRSGGRVELIIEHDTTTFTVKVADTGIGIPDEAIPRLFDRFYRVPRPASDNVEGTGLGLAITRAIIERHGGQIWVDSQVDVGSTFAFTVPIRPAPHLQSFRAV